MSGRDRARPESDELGRQANLLGALAFAVGDRVDGAVAAGSGRSPSSSAALVSLNSYLDGASVDRVRAPLGLSHSATVRVVDGLAEAGFVQRAPGSDQRSVRVVLTPAGRKAARDAAERRKQALTSALATLTDRERVALARLHEKLLESLTDGRAAAARTCRLCDPDACGHFDDRCPATRGADRASAVR